MRDGKAVILIVEDNDDNRVIYSLMLEHVGYHVLEATDGLAAVETARAEHPDLVLMDVSIPGIDGWEATRRLKSDPVTAGIPIIALTAHALAEDRLRAREVGCDGSIAKPVEPRVVVDEIGRMLAERAG